MENGSREQVLAFRQDIQGLLRRKVQEAIEVVLQEELDLALGSARYERRPTRRGYRNGVGFESNGTSGWSRTVG